KVSFNASQTVGELSVDGAFTVVAPGGTKSLALGGLSIANSGRLDLADNGMTLSYGNGPDPIATMRGYLLSGYNNGLWDGAGIMSSSAYADLAHHTGIGYADAADGTGINPTPNSIKFVYTLYGDATLDK